MDKENASILFKALEIRRTWRNGERSKGWGQIVTPIYFQSVTICHELKKRANDNYLSSPDGKKGIEEGAA